MSFARNVVLALALLVGADAFQAPAPSRVARVIVNNEVDPNANPASFGTGPSLDYNPDKYADESNAGNFRKLGDALQDGDIERKKALKEQEERENKMEFDREERRRKIAFMENMPDATPAGKVADFMYKGGVTEILEKLDHDLVGLKPVKKRVREIAALLVLDKMRRKLGFETAVPSLHMCFTGAPGTGKTTVAVRMGQILQRMGYCRTGHVVVATRDDLVGQYVGHTAPKTKEVIKKAMGGVLLIDEAYYLYNAANDRDYGQESIEILLNVMEKNTEDLIVVLAGYKDRMDTFFSFIPGMSSRIGNHVDFPNYETDELVEIAQVMVRDLEYELAFGADQTFKNYIAKRRTMPFFSNARTVRNAMDRARMNSAIRLFNEGMSGQQTTVKDLKSITSADFQIILDEIVAAGDDAIVA
jgi:probable Rubsico expression protein CbbX